MILAVDTNILLDILIPNTAYIQSSLSCLLSIVPDDKLIICEVVYAELGSQFLSSQDLNRFLRDTAIRLVSSNEKSLFKVPDEIIQAVLSHSHIFFTPDRRIKVYCHIVGIVPS